MTAGTTRLSAVFPRTMEETELFGSQRYSEFMPRSNVDSHLENADADAVFEVKCNRMYEFEENVVIGLPENLARNL